MPEGCGLSWLPPSLPPLTPPPGNRQSSAPSRFNSRYNPFEAGLQFLIDWRKNDFLGAEALRRIKDEGARRKLVCLALERPLSVFGGEAVLVDGSAVAQSTSGNFGHSVGKSLVLAYLPSELLGQGAIEVEAFGERSAASTIRGSAYDPERRKILC